MCENYVDGKEEYQPSLCVKENGTRLFFGKSKAPFLLSHLLKTGLTPFFHLRLMGFLLFHHHHLKQLLSYLMEHRGISSGWQRRSHYVE